jgi:hypothetical protein
MAALWLFGGPITYAILLVDTWQRNVGVLPKIVISLSFDIALAAIWPITWLLWLGSELLGWGSPLSHVLGIF